MNNSTDNKPFFPRDVELFIDTLASALEYADLCLHENFLAQPTQANPEVDGRGLLFTQLNVKRSNISIKKAKTTTLMVTVRGLHVFEPDCERFQTLMFSSEQTPQKVAALVAAALLTRRPIVPPSCPHC